MGHHAGTGSYSRQLLVLVLVLGWADHDDQAD
jgi:hypothetical protein